jgi:hypothetical protein
VLELLPELFDIVGVVVKFGDVCFCIIFDRSFKSWKVVSKS